MKKLKHAGVRTDEIAKQMQLSTETVRRWLRRLREAGHDVPRDKPGRQRLELK